MILPSKVIKFEEHVWYFLFWQTRNQISLLLGYETGKFQLKRNPLDQS